MGFLEQLRETLNTNPFKGFFREGRVRPPGAVSEKQFMELCIRCARCIEVCPYESIKRADLLEKLQIGTPYIYTEERACYLCMKCPPVCPTGALDPTLSEPEKVRIGIARVNEKTCLNYLFIKDETGGNTNGYAMICSTCYNVCPLQDTAIVMKDYILPVPTEDCVGCGICVEKCPVEPKAITIIPTGMGETERAGIHYRRSRHAFENAQKPKGVIHGDELLQVKERLTTRKTEKDFSYEGIEVHEGLDGWE